MSKRYATSILLRAYQQRVVVLKKGIGLRLLRPRRKFCAIPFLLLFLELMVRCSAVDGFKSVPKNIDAQAPSGSKQILPVTATAEMNGKIFDLEVAKTPHQKSLGLMFRTSLPNNRGMLFPFEQPRRIRFWMKDVLIPLDMVFLRNGTVVAITGSAPPCITEPCPTYGPTWHAADQVIELRGGRVAEVGLEIGDTVNVQSMPGT